MLPDIQYISRAVMYPVSSQGPNSHLLNPLLSKTQLSTAGLSAFLITMLEDYILSLPNQSSTKHMVEVTLVLSYWETGDRNRARTKG